MVSCNQIYDGEYWLSYKISIQRQNSSVNRAFDVYSIDNSQKYGRVYIISYSNYDAIYVERKDMKFCELMIKSDQIDKDDIDTACRKIMYS